MLRKIQETFKRKWGIENDLRFWLIMAAFAVTGTTIAVIKPWIFNWLGISLPGPFPVSFIIYLILVTPFYFLILIIIGSLMGEYRFFRNFIVTMLPPVFRKRISGKPNKSS